MSFAKRLLPYVLGMACLAIMLAQSSKSYVASSAIDSMTFKLSRAQIPMAPDVQKKEFVDRMKQIYGTSKVEIQSYQSNTAPGTVSSGVVVKLTTEEITLDTTPCLNRKKLITFHKVYSSADATNIRCGNKSYSRIQVKQR